jgi:hypothetical protein
MRNLEKEYEVHRFDIRTSEKKIFKKYSDTIKSHDQFDIRLDDSSSDDLLTIKESSIQRIFSLIDECPEEHILFLYLSEKKNIPLTVSINDTSLISNQLNTSDRLDRLDTYDIENPSIKQEIIKENRESQYYCIFSILYFIMAGLLSIHFLQYICSKQVRIKYF